MTGIEHADDPLVSGSLTSHDGADADPSADGPDDRELLRRVRAGEDAAFADLFSRHAGVARGFALRYATDAAEADDIAAEAFFRVLQAVRRGSGPEDNVRGYLLTVVRRLAAEWRTRRRDVPVADEELSRRVDPDADQAGTRAEAHLIARAFTSLPQRWRRVLWQVEVEGERPAVVAPRFGLSPNATAALARRAREGLRAAYLQAHVPPATGSTACRAVIDKLGAYTAGLVRGSEAQRIVAHLSTCSSCRAVHAELADVCAGLRRYAGAMPGLIPAAALPRHSVPHVSGLGTKSAALAGKAAAFGVRFKLAIATMSMVAVGGLGVTAGPLFMHMTNDIDADQGTVQQLPVLPNVMTSGASGTIRHPVGPGLPPESRGTAIRGPRGGRQAQQIQAGGSTTSNGASSSAASDSSSGTGSTGQSTTNSAHAGMSPQLQGGGSTTNQQPADTSTSATTGRKPLSVTPTTDQSVTQTTNPGMTPHETAQETVWSTSYTTNGTTVWITEWKKVWQDNQAPAGR